MTLRLAFSTLVLGFSVTATTPAPTVAEMPRGFVNCRIDSRIVPFGFNSGMGLGQAILDCFAADGEIASIQFGEG